MARIKLQERLERERIAAARAARPENRVCELARDVDEALSIWAIKTSRACDQVAEALGEDDDAVRALRAAVASGEALPLACRVEIPGRR